MTQLVAGQGLNRHKDYRNHVIEEYLNYTINFGQYEGGHLEMLRNGEWQSCAVPLIWTEFTADIIEHRVREVTSGERFAVTLFTPSHLERLSERDWVNLESRGFPVHLYAERARYGTGVCLKKEAVLVEELDTEIHVVEAVVDADKVQLPVLEAQQAEKAGTPEDALSQLAGQIPQPNPVCSETSERSLQRFALLTRDFNCAMGLPEAAAMKIVTPERGQQYGRMMREEIRELEEAIASGAPPTFLLN